MDVLWTRGRIEFSTLAPITWDGETFISRATGFRDSIEAVVAVAPAEPALSTPSTAGPVITAVNLVDDSVETVECALPPVLRSTIGAGEHALWASASIRARTSGSGPTEGMAIRQTSQVGPAAWEFVVTIMSGAPREIRVSWPAVGLESARGALLPTPENPGRHGLR